MSLRINPKLIKSGIKMKKTLLFCMAVLTVGTVFGQQDNSMETKAAMMRYLDSEHEDLSMLAEDVLFINMATGDKHTGPAEVRELLDYVYHIAFDAKAEKRNLIIEGNHAVLEADIVGTHKGEFAGVPATNKQVRIPLCVVYDLENGMIKQARIYFEVQAFLTQVQ